MKVIISNSAYSSTHTGDTSQLYFEKTTHEGETLYTLKNGNFLRRMWMWGKCISWDDYKLQILTGTTSFKTEELDLFRRNIAFLKVRRAGAKITAFFKAHPYTREHQLTPTFLESHYHGESHIQYLTAEERQHYEVTVCDGRVLRDQIPYQTPPTSEHPTIFVWSGDGKLYLGSSIVQLFHHSSFLAGEAVLAAGHIKTRADGTISVINNRSGHYHPGPRQMRSFLEYLQRSGRVDLRQVSYQPRLPNMSSSPVYFQASDYLLRQPPNAFLLGSASILIKYESNGDIQLSAPPAEFMLHHDCLKFLKDYGFNLNRVSVHLENRKPGRGDTYFKALQALVKRS